MAKAKMEKLQAGRMAKSAIERTAQLIDRFGPRLTGSEACLKTARALRDELADHCDTVGAERFPVRPGAFLGWIRLMVASYPAVLLFLWLGLPLPALIVSGLGLVVMVFEFLFYHELIDPLFPAMTGENVHGVIEPEGDVRTTVVFSGHHDSARVFTFYANKPSLYMVRVGLGLGSFVVSALVSLLAVPVSMVRGSLWVVDLPSGLLLVLLVLLTALSPAVVYLWNFASKEGTPGAGDNLVASSMAVELARYLSRNRDLGNPLRHTRVVLASFDAEEAGLRGSRAYYAKHGAEFRAVPSWNFNVDCLYRSGDLSFLTSDINGSVKLSQQMATECVTIARSMGFETKSLPIAFMTGGTDAAEAAKAGLEAVTLMGMTFDAKNPAAVYHTPSDLPEAIEAEAVEQALSIAIRFIEHVDAATVQEKST